MSKSFVPSGKAHECKICGRTKDGDCRSSEAENVWLCHTHQQGKPGELLNGYKYLRLSDKGAGWGIWIHDTDNGSKPLKPPKADRRQEFVYQGRDGKPLARVVRVDANGSRKFYQEHWDGKQWVKGLPDSIKKQIPVYRYTDIHAAIANGQVPFWVEGESCANLLWEQGIPATTSIGGSKGYRSYGSYKEDLQGVTPILCPDRDQEGMAYMAEVAKDFPDALWCYVYPDSHAHPLPWQNLPKNNGLDIVEWVKEGAKLEDIMGSVGKRDRSPAKQNELDTPEGRKTKYQRVIAELGRIEQIEDLGLQDFEKLLLSKRESVPLKELGEIHRKSKFNREIQSVSVLELCRQPDEHQEHLIDNILELGTSVLVCSQSKTGKTPLVYDIAYHVATGEPWLDQFNVCTDGGVLIIQTDESVRASKKNFRRRGLHHLANVEFTNDFTIEEIPQLRRKIETLKQTIGLKLVVIDSLTTINRNNAYTENDTEYARDLYLLTMLAAEMGVTIMITHHRNKGGQRSGLDIVSGNHQISAAVDDIWAFHRMSEKEDPSKLKRVLERIAAHDGDLFQYVLQLHLDDRTWSLEGVYDPNANEGERVQEGVPVRTDSIAGTTSDKIWNFINQDDRRWTHTDLAEALNMNENTIKRLLFQLIDSGKVDREQMNLVGVGAGRKPYVYFRKNFQGNSEASDQNSKPAQGKASEFRSTPEVIEIEFRSTQPVIEIRNPSTASVLNFDQPPIEIPQKNSDSSNGNGHHPPPKVGDRIQLVGSNGHSSQMPDSVEGFKIGDRVLVTLEELEKEDQKELIAEGFVGNGEYGVIKLFIPDRLEPKAWRVVIQLDSGIERDIDPFYLRKAK